MGAWYPEPHGDTLCKVWAIGYGAHTERIEIGESAGLEAELSRFNYTGWYTVGNRNSQKRKQHVSKGVEGILPADEKNHQQGIWLETGTE